MLVHVGVIDEGQITNDVTGSPSTGHVVGVRGQRQVDQCVREAIARGYYYGVGRGGY